MTSTPRGIVIIVVGTLSLLSIIGMTTLALALFYKGYTADPVILAAFIPITSGSIGALSTLLANTRQPSAVNGTSTSISTSDPSTVTVAAKTEGHT